MKKLLLPVLLMLLASSCASIRVSSDYDKTAPFSVYKTYAYAPEAMNLNISELNKRRLIDALDKELQLKGFTLSDQPDVLIDLKFNAQTKQSATTNTATPYGGRYYGYRWRSSFATTTVSYENYTEGTLFIEMIDAAKKQLVWQGRGIKTLDPDASYKKRESNINSAVKTIVELYPPKL
jgi:hypothetical protein